MKLYEAFVKTENGWEFRTEQAYSAKSFAKELRNRGYRVRRVEDAKVFEFCLDKTDCRPIDYKAVKLCLRETGAFERVYDFYEKVEEKENANFWKRMERHEKKLQEFIAR